MSSNAGQGAEERLGFGAVSKRYGRVQALSGVTLSIGPGEIFALVGRNGSGKSTLLRCAAKLIPPDAGEVRFLGRTSADKSLFRRIGVLLSVSPHYDRLSGFENAWFFARSYGLSPRVARDRLEWFFRWASLDDRKNDTVEGYSYGMKRKLAIIEAFVHKPDLIILDEPSMGLDYDSRIRLYDLIRQAAGDGAGVLLATNDVDEAASVATRCGILSDGNLVATGTPEDLIGRLGSCMRIDLVLAVPVRLDRLQRLPGIESVDVTGTDEGFALSILAKPGSEMLGRAIAAVVEEGGAVVSAAVQNPGLGDVVGRYGEGRGR